MTSSSVSAPRTNREDAREVAERRVLELVVTEAERSELLADEKFMQLVEMCEPLRPAAFALIWRDMGAEVSRLGRYVEAIDGDVYLWRIGEISAKKAMAAIRETLADLRASREAGAQTKPGTRLPTHRTGGTE